MSYTLKGELREKLGSRPARVLRSGGRIPCSIQGGEGEHVNLSIDHHDFFTARRHHEHVFTIELPGGEEITMVRELQWDSLGEELLHVEFRRVVLGQETEAEVGLEIVGHAAGGIVTQLVTQLTVAAIPSKIPDSIVIHAHGMEPGHPVIAGELELPEGVRLVSDPDVPVAVVAAGEGMAADEEETPAAEELGAAPDQPSEEGGGDSA